MLHFATQHKKGVFMWNLVELVIGEIPQQYDFLKIFGFIFELYIFISIFKLFIDIIKDLLRGV